VAKVVVVERRARARVARRRRPRVLGDDRARVLLDGAVEQRRVELAELVPDVVLDLEVGRDAHVLVVAHLEAAFGRQDVHDQILLARRRRQPSRIGSVKSSLS